MESTAVRAGMAKVAEARGLEHHKQWQAALDRYTEAIQLLLETARTRGSEKKALAPLQSRIEEALERTEALRRIIEEEQEKKQQQQPEYLELERQYLSYWKKEHESHQEQLEREAKFEERLTRQGRDSREEERERAHYRSEEPSERNVTIGMGVRGESQFTDRIESERVRVRGNEEENGRVSRRESAGVNGGVSRRVSVGVNGGVSTSTNAGVNGGANIGVNGGANGGVNGGEVRDLLRARPLPSYRKPMESYTVSAVQSVSATKPMADSNAPTLLSPPRHHRIRSRSDISSTSPSLIGQCQPQGQQGQQGQQGYRGQQCSPCVQGSVFYADAPICGQVPLERRREEDRHREGQEIGQEVRSELVVNRGEVRHSPGGGSSMFAAAPSASAFGRSASVSLLSSTGAVSGLGGGKERGGGGGGERALGSAFGFPSVFGGQPMGGREEWSGNQRPGSERAMGTAKSTPTMTSVPSSRPLSLGRSVTTANLHSLKQREDEEKEEREREEEETEAEISGRKRWSLVGNWGNNGSHKQVSGEEERANEEAVTMYMLKMGVKRAVARQAGTAVMDSAPLKAHLALRYRFTLDGSYCPVKGLSTASKYAFEFEDYAPFVFRCIRRLQAVECSDFLRSVCSGGLRTMDAAGKSGSHFFLSNDGRFVLKTMFEAEVTFFHSILDRYVAYMTKERSTLICHFFGLYTIYPQQGSVMHFIAMENILPRPEVPVSKIFDLKGSTVGRKASEADKKGPGPVILKDLDFDVPFLLGPTKLMLLFEQLKKDTAFLECCEIMDYSLLVGIVDLDQVKVIGRIPWALPEELSVFRKDDGGFRSSDGMDHPMNVVYYMGIIDVLQPYNLRKKVEHALKSLRESPDALSCVDPAQYSKRFVDFVIGNTASPVAFGSKPAFASSNTPSGFDMTSVPPLLPRQKGTISAVSSQQAERPRLPAQVTWTPD